VAIVLGLDQHRAQISAEWLDTITGEISRARVIPADRGAVRKFLGPFKGAGLEVALGATTGWRFLVEELERVGAEVHLAEPAEAAALKGKKKRANTDWADARHLRELLLIGRIPESWIPPTHILDLRARVRTRHLLSHQRTEWQQRIHSVLYHHGVPRQRNLLSLANREWLDGLTLLAAAREQITIALSVIDVLDLELVPFDQVLRAQARSQPGCRALINAIYEVGELTAITIVAELGDARRQSDDHRGPGHLSRQGPPALRWALYEAAQRARFPASPDRPLLPAARGPGRREPCLPCALMQAAQRQLPHPQRPRRPSARAGRLTSAPRQAPRSTDEPRPAPGETAADQLLRGRPRKNERPHHHLPEHPIKHHVADPEPTRAEHRSKPGRPRTHTRPSTRPRTPATPPTVPRHTSPTRA